MGRYPITVTVTDEQGASATLGFNLDLSNTPPFATATIPDQAYDDTDTITAIDLSGVFTDPDTQSLTLTLSGPNGAAALPATLTFDGTQITARWTPATVRAVRMGTASIPSPSPRPTRIMKARRKALS